MSDHKVFLLLQGPPCRFISRLSSSLSERGATCYRINFSLSDYLFNHKHNAVSFRDSFDLWEQFLVRFIKDNGVTDIIYHADRLPYHAVARDVAQQLNINAISFENGYLRPHWLTLEHGGMSELSHFPSDPEHIIQSGKHYQLPTPIQGLGHPFWVEATHEVVFNLINQFDYLFFPRYKSDKMYHQLVEYLNYIPRFLKKKLQTSKIEAIASEINDLNAYYLFPLQMENDYQIRKNSRFSSQDIAIEEVFAALAESGGDAFLVIKIHPHDNGIKKWHRIVPELAKNYGVEHRVLLIDGGDLTLLIENSQGVITINSTVGVHALQALKPVICLGVATYDIAGLTSSQTLNDFLIKPDAPDDYLVECFVKLIAHTIQIQGGYFLKTERNVAIQEMTNRLINGHVNQPNAFISPPPRLGKS